MSQAHIDDGLTARQRLARSREAITRHLQREERVADEYGTVSADEFLGSDQSHSVSGWYGFLRHAVSSWWYHHPARTAAEMARPIVEDYTRKKPAKVLGIAAGVGAVAMLIKPWRLISLTGLAIAALKSPQITGVVMQMLAKTHRDTRRIK